MADSVDHRFPQGIQWVLPVLLPLHLSRGNPCCFRDCFVDEPAGLFGMWQGCDNHISITFKIPGNHAERSRDRYPVVVNWPRRQEQ